MAKESSRKDIPHLGRLTILLAFLMFVVTVFSGIASSGAWYSVTKISTSTILSAGSLDLEVTAESLSTQLLEPGIEYTQLGSFCTRNVGTTVLKYRGIFVSPSPLSNNLLDFMTLKLEQKVTEEWQLMAEIHGRTPIETESLRYYFKFPDQDPNIINNFIISGTLAQNDENCYRIWTRLDIDTPNYIQGKSIYFNLLINATQVTNPGW